MSSVSITVAAADQAAPPATDTKKHQASVRLLKSGVDGAPEAQVRSRAWAFEDEFNNRYGFGALDKGLEILEPPYLAKTLEALCQQNNTLNVCISAVVTNLHCTGWSIDPVDGDATPDETVRESIESFFEEPYPGVSFSTMRKRLGRDIERTGNGYLEVIRNPEGRMIFVRRLDPKMIRLVKLDGQVSVPMRVNRNGEDVEVSVGQRFRRYVQSLGGTQRLYFKEFGCPRRLSAAKGTWFEDGEAVAPTDQASEIIHFTKDEDSLTPYGVPCWISQLPSVLGSRKAEEHNLDFFDAGGVPPFMILVHGGTLGDEAARELRDYFASAASNKHVVPVLEAQSTGGSTEAAGSVRVTVERFGAERQDDSMFENYDARCESRIRRAWRLPPIFVGQSADYNFATAFTSYTTTEVQVFKPERDEFDEIINRTLMRELDPDGVFVFRSLPITVRDIEHQFKALEYASAAQALSREQLVDVLNELSGMSMRVDDTDLAVIDTPGSETQPGTPSKDPTAGKAPAPGKGKATPAKKGAVYDPHVLAGEAFDLMAKGDVAADDVLTILRDATQLAEEDLRRFSDHLMSKAAEAAMDEDVASAFVGAVVALAHGARNVVAPAA